MLESLVTLEDGVVLEKESFGKGLIGESKCFVASTIQYSYNGKNAFIERIKGGKQKKALVKPLFVYADRYMFINIWIHWSILKSNSC